ncbi:MAG: DUF3854 domain-containing protein, partial [Actinobacteria bacterium]|nr:DUF3854 domain-containing protein [Actinomycetota bacterium]
MRKADAGASHALCCIALLGVWSFRGKNEKGGITLLADWDSIALNGREVRIVFDSDVTTKPEVQAALARLREHLQRKGAKVLVVYLPGGPNGVKVGLDDFLLTHTVDELQALVQAPAPEPQAALPSIELLDEAPPMLTRPLALVSGRAYAASWLWTRTTTTEYLDTKAGQVRRLREPRVDTERRLFVVRDDGAVFGDGADHGIAELGLQVALPSAPRDAKLWSTQGVKSYRAGRRADPRNVFERMVGTVDRFMSFDRSLADQRTMCEFVSCYALSTWFLDAFSVIGFLWPNGGYGSGKTKLGVLVCELAYLGEVLLSGSSYACLRDLADMGATLLFDDAEALSDPKRSDPDKRNLLLAGNRRGAVVAVKEAAADGTWKTRLVNAYCPRLFTAIRLPDSVLGSRSVVLPVVRTADAGKANAEVLEYGLWPTNQRQLLDDLWALALANLARMPEHEQAVNTDAPLTGRNLEPWRPALAVAHWLEAEGETGQYGRMCDLARSYQTERGELEYSDLTRLVVRALCAVVPTVDSVPSVPSSKWGVPIEFDSALVTTEVNRIATEEELAADGMEYASSQKVGRVLERTLRLRAATRTAKRKRRQVTPAELNNIALSYGISVPFIVPSPDPPASDLAHSAQTALSAQLEQAELPTVPFLPSAEWQDVPPGTVLPPGFEARMNFA